LELEAKAINEMLAYEQVRPTQHKLHEIFDPWVDTRDTVNERSPPNTGQQRPPTPEPPKRAPTSHSQTNTPLQQQYEEQEQEIQLQKALNEQLRQRLQALQAHLEQQDTFQEEDILLDDESMMEVLEIDLDDPELLEELVVALDEQEAGLGAGALLEFMRKNGFDVQFVPLEEVDIYNDDEDKEEL
jgi:hypothetical protein